MAADMPVELMAPVSDVVESAPPLEHHTTSEPDFWIDTSTSGSLDDYFDQVEQFLTEAHNLTGWAQVRNNYNFTGAGQTVAVIDSGIAYNHFALGGGFGAGYRVVGGWDFTEENDSNPYDDGPTGGHGTHVSGIVGSSSGTHTGVAPGVDLVGLRVFNDAGQGFFSWMENALRWVHTNRNSFANPITTVNMSLGVSSWNSATIPLWANLEDELAQLKADGIFIAVSAGNSFASYNMPGLSYPAASPNVVPVMSVDDAGNMSGFSQRLGRAIAAPGQSIMSTIPDYKGNNNGIADDFAPMGGTSMASPYIAGASVIIRQAMQSIGMTGVNQDTIYNHMMATADSFFDSVTNQTYKRLNLGRAVTTLMGGATPPADDYGDTAGTAFDLGSSSGGGINRTGVIGTTSDVDCFKFTATAAGRVTFTATAGAGMNPTWQLWGGTALSAPAGSVSFNVVAGQTYTVGLSSPNATGNYTITSSLAAADPFTYTDWGTVAFNTVDNVAVNGERWYRVQATRNGLLTVCGMYNSGGGTPNVALYDGNLTLIANGTSANGLARVDGAAMANGYYYVKVSGTNSDVDFKLVNLVSQSGLTVTVNGTSGNDAFAFTGGTTNTLLVNGVGYVYNSTAANTFNFSTGLGVDSVAVTGKSTAETFTLSQGVMTVVGVGYAVNVNDAEHLAATSGGGADVVNLYDSAGNDSLSALSNSVTLTLGNGCTLQANNFAKVKAWATAGGTDAATFTDTAGDDLFIAGPLRAILTGTGYWNEAEGFDSTAAYATGGGYDRVDFYDSAGDDTLYGWANRANLSGAGFTHDAYNFEKTTTYGTTGNDVAALYDGVGNDAFTAWSNRATFVGNGFNHEIRSFDRVKAIATNGGVDTATFYDTAGYDIYIAGAVRGIVTGAGYWNEAEGFDSTVANSSGGGDRADFYDTAGDDTFTAWSNRATIVGAGMSHEAKGFRTVKAWATTGVDSATFYDTAGYDLYIAGQIRGILTGAGSYWNEAEGFDSTIAYSTGGGDRADFYDSAGDDLYTAWWNRATFTGTGFTHDARGFRTAKAWSTAGGNDRAVFYDSIGNDLFIAGSVRAVLTGTNFWNEAEGFDETEGHAVNGGYDRFDAYGSLGVDSLTGTGNHGTYTGTGYKHDFDGFDQVMGRGLLGNDDIDLTAIDYAFSQAGA